MGDTVEIRRVNGEVLKSASRSWWGRRDGTRHRREYEGSWQHPASGSRSVELGNRLVRPGQSQEGAWGAEGDFALKLGQPVRDWQQAVWDNSKVLRSVWNL